MERSQAERLAPVRVVPLDLDGVLYVEEALVPGARDAAFCWTVNLRYFLVSRNATSGTGL